MIDLKTIKRNKSKPPRMIIYGDRGLGKTTVASKFPSPIFVQTEDGLGVLDVPAFDLAQSYDDIMQALEALATQDHEYKTVVVDSIDWAEPLVWKKTCQRLGVASIEQPGYGKGYVETSSEWRDFVKALTYLRDEKGMIILMLAHSQIIHIEDPTLAPYDSHGLKLHKRASGILEEFADIIGFAAMSFGMLNTSSVFMSTKSPGYITIPVSGIVNLLKLYVFLSRESIMSETNPSYIPARSPRRMSSDTG